MAKKKKGFLSEEGFVPSKQWIAKMKLKAEEKAAYKKKKKKEKKQAKAKREAELLIKKKAKKEAGQVALKKLKSARQAIIDYRRMKAGKRGGFFDDSLESSAIKKEFLKLEQDVLFFKVKE